MLNRTNDITNFEMALGMLLEPNPLQYDWDNYLAAALEIGMSNDNARQYIQKYKAELGLR